jgi:hypothetical protein
LPTRESESLSCQPIADDGERLATIGRAPNVELRVGLKEFKGHRFVRLQEWAVNMHNSQWWPSKGKGCSIKLRELDAVVAALLQAIEQSSGTADVASPNRLEALRRAHQRVRAAVRAKDVARQRPISQQTQSA